MTNGGENDLGGTSLSIRGVTCDAWQLCDRSRDRRRLFVAEQHCNLAPDHTRMLPADRPRGVNGQGSRSSYYWCFSAFISAFLPFPWSRRMCYSYPSFFDALITASTDDSIAQWWWCQLAIRRRLTMKGSYLFVDLQQSIFRKPKVIRGTDSKCGGLNP